MTVLELSDILTGLINDGYAGCNICVHAEDNSGCVTAREVSDVYCDINAADEQECVIYAYE